MERGKLEGKARGIDSRAFFVRDVKLIDTNQIDSFVL